MGADCILLTTAILIHGSIVGIMLTRIGTRLEYLDDELRRGRHDAIDLKAVREQTSVARAVLDRVLRP